MNNVLKTQVVRETIIDELGSLLGNSFEIKNKKGENYFIKSDAAGYLKIQFFYENFYPLHCTVHFVLSIWQNEIQDFRKKVYLINDLPFNDAPNIGFFEGDFISELKDRLVKYRQGYKNKITSFEDLNRTLTWYKSLLPNLVNIYDKFATLSTTAIYLDEIKDLLVKNCAGYAIETHLISARFSNPEKYENLVSFYNEKLPLTIKDYGVMARNTIDSVARLHAYLIKYQ